jgi:hypothetical protein
VPQDGETAILLNAGSTAAGLPGPEQLVEWRSVLGDLADEDVPGYVSPAVADEVSGLPTTYIDAGTAEVYLRSRYAGLSCRAKLSAGISASW